MHTNPLGVAPIKRVLAPVGRNATVHQPKWQKLYINAKANEKGSDPFSEFELMLSPLTK
jgi:hypothetical protein